MSNIDLLAYYHDLLRQPLKLDVRCAIEDNVNEINKTLRFLNRCLIGTKDLV